MAKTKEVHFEDAIEHHLVTRGGWVRGAAADYDRQRALLPAHLFGFLQNTQPKLLADLKKQHKELETSLLDTLGKVLDSRGTLDVLRHGFKFQGKQIDCAYFKPPSGLNPDVIALYAKNRLAVTRQVRFVPDSDESVDLLFSLNGFPVATVEIKNAFTGQSVEDAIAQYKRRDPKQLLFQWRKRALVHFAVDTDVAYMTTRLAGNDTRFLPFNRGDGHRGGNPPRPGDYRTGYLWAEVWERESFLDLLGRFLHVSTEEKQVAGKLVTTETVIFPRYHQLDAVRRLEVAARGEGPGQHYLIQHSAGSGKSNSIAWLAYRLATLHDKSDERVFDSVLVITDRLVLDRQLQDTIFQFEHKPGFVERIDESSEQLAKAIMGGVPIVITTVQKFPFVAEKIGKLPKRSYALIVDEAHSSATGESSHEMKKVLAGRSGDDPSEGDEVDVEDIADEVVRAMEARGRQKNMSFFAFTATPKTKTLALFGRPDAEGKPQASHLYSMRQAIEEGFILDVLRNYTTYKTFFKLAHDGEKDRKVDKKQAAGELGRFIALHPHNLAQKTQIMVEHYRSKVRGRIGGKAKAMVVTRSRVQAVRYYQTFRTYLKEKAYSDIGVLVAFSGTVLDPDVPDVKYTEAVLNGFGEGELAKRFDTSGFHVLIVADKYQTGFDQPLLHTMYVDKKLSGVRAVQTLSRLNRTHPEKEDTFVLDFANEATDIQAAFAPYYEGTTAEESAGPDQLYDLQHRLESAQIFSRGDIEAFAKVFYSQKKDLSGAENKAMNAIIDPARARFDKLEEDEKDAFRDAIGRYVSLYSFLSQIMEFTDGDLEKLYSYARKLETKLPHDSRKPLVLGKDVALTSYRNRLQFEGHLSIAEPVALRGIKGEGSRKGPSDEARLSEIIELWNERFKTEFTKADELFIQEAIAEAQSDKKVIERALANTEENFALAMVPVIEKKMVERIERNHEIVDHYLNDKPFQQTAFQAMVKRIYRGIRRAAEDSVPPPSGT